MTQGKKDKVLMELNQRYCDRLEAEARAQESGLFDEFAEDFE